jgi:hypothetical protein
MSELDGTETPPVTYIPVGQRPPGVAGDISIADSIVPAVQQAAAASIVNQSEGSRSYYMEGMGAPMGSFRNYGHETRAITIVDRSLSEASPGVYRGRVKIPVEGIYDIAFMMDSPQFLHCFTAKVAPNEASRDAGADKLALSYEVKNRYLTIGEPRSIRFRLENPATGEPVANIPDVSILYYRSDGRGRKVQPAKFIGDGVYEAIVEASEPATYYVYVGAPSQAMQFTDNSFLSLLAVPEAGPAKQETAH